MGIILHQKGVCDIIQLFKQHLFDVSYFLLIEVK